MYAAGFRQRRIIRFLFWVLAMGYCLSAGAQNYPYLVDFETVNTSPASKSYASSDTIILSNIPWVMPGVYLGAMTINDFRNGVHAARIRLSNNSTGDPGYLEMAADLPFGMDTLYFQTAMYGSETGGKLLISYSISGGLSWIPLGDTIEVPVHDSPALISRVINQSGSVRIRIEKAEGSDARIDLDDLSVNTFGYIPPLNVLSKSPSGADIPLSTTSLGIHFDQAIAAGSGILSLQQSGGAAQTIMIPSPQVSISDSVAIFSGIALASASSYYVLLTDSSFTSIDGIRKNDAIVDSSFWYFATEDTTSMPPVPPLNSLNETFLACNSAQNLMGVFRQFSARGIQSWSCASEGHQDSFCVRMNGGIAPGASDNNEDWLISSRPLDFSDMTAPMLSFWEKSVYGGAVMRALQLSKDYAGYDDPGVANWTTINIPGFDEAPGENWVLVDGIDLEPFKDSPFYLAFSYECGPDGAYSLYYDDVQVAEAAGIDPLRQSHLSLKVLGPAKGSSIPLLLELDQTARLNIGIIDLNGRLVYREAGLFFPAGNNKYVLRPGSLQPGIYLIRACNEQGRATRKVIVER